jgi:serine protease
MNYRRIALLQALVLIAATLVASAPTTAAEIAPATSYAAAASTSSDQRDWGSRLIITMAPGVRATDLDGVRALQQRGRFAVVDLGRRVLPSDLARFAGPGVLSVEPDLILHPTVSPNDARWADQWDMSDAGAGAADYSVHAPDAWALTTGSAAITVAVLDTGITSHADLAGRTVAGYDFVSDVAFANDGDGRDANPADPGDWITTAEAASGYFKGCIVESSSWHGTHVAGTIGAAGNNSVGVAGLNWVSKIQPIRVLGKCGGSLIDIADAIAWAAGVPGGGVATNTTPAKVISLSLGGTAFCSWYMQSAIDAARAAGAIVVVAAGNSNTSAALSTPANCSGVIAVAATGRDGKRAYYSNYGSQVDIAAPGGDARKGNQILSTLNTGSQGPVADTYAYYQGTSMATPHVAGVISLLLSLKPALSESDVIDLITKTATPFPADAGSHPCSTSGTCGAGIINAAAALASASSDRVVQLITMSSLPSRVLGEAPFSPGATVAPSNLAPVYTSSRSSVCTTDGTLITLVAKGTCTITASQPGSELYSPASGVTKTFTVLAAPTIKVNSGAAYTASTAVSLGLTYPSIAGTVEISNSSDFAVKTSSAVTNSVNWTLPAGDGAKSIYLRFSGGSMMSPVTISGGITLDSVGPLISSATATARGSSTSFTFRVAATDAGSGNAKIAVSTNGGSTTVKTVNYASNFAYTSRASTFWVRVQDKVGNWSAWTPVAVSRT